MNKQDILAKLPERIRAQVTITGKGSYWAISHAYVDDESLFALTREAVEKLGGKYNGYYSKEAHYEIPKEAKGVTPLSVSMDKSKPPKLEVEEIGVKLVNVDDLVQSPFWTREFREDESFNELVASIRKFGVAQNLLVRLVRNQKEIVLGHRRWLAARKAGLTQVPVKIRKLSDEEVLLLQFDENERREDLTDMEKAHSLRRMIDFFDCTQEALAQKLSKSQSWVSRHLAMLSEELRDIMPRGIIQEGELTEGQARELLNAPPEKREELLDTIKDEAKVPSMVKIREIVKPKLVTCEGCGVASSDVEDWNGHGILLCSKCMKDANAHTERYLGKKRTREVVKEIKVFKPQETWEQRKAVMQPQHSRMEQAQLLKLQEANLRPVITDRPFCIRKTIPDFYFPTKHLAIYLDGPVHKGKEDRDEKLRTALTKQHGLTVKSIEYTVFTQKEVDRVFVLLKEAYENV